MPPVSFSTVFYDHGGGREAVLAALPDQPRAHILIIPPLFDEMNRMRRTLALAMRDLAARDLASLLIDLPGCNESLAPLEAQSLDDWAGAVRQAIIQLKPSHIASFRGGALIDCAGADDGDAPLPRWRCAPLSGATLLKAMIRTRMAADRESGLASSFDALLATGREAGLELAGNRLGPAMIRQLHDAAPVAAPHIRTLGLCAPENSAPDMLAGSPLWLRAEPGEDRGFAAAIAAGLAAWAHSGTDRP